ncbi:diheme cytochrome c [Methyloterricola oryzae]|uniref:diheme cytochrome c n=1 Tax=Methyloterricola oryzae TaxID=1495050 RepID=UPI0005EBDC53|nr:diheme cytochrome c [Methyloterricola oryzae]
MKLPLSVLMTVLLFAAVEAAASGGKQLPPDPRYTEECGTCHVPYPARLLPASSWRALLAGLDRHFDSDASLEPDVQRQIQAYLEQGARREPNPPPAQPLLRITESRWFLHEHDEVPKRVWDAVKKPSNCGACHLGAGNGRFSEHDVQLPTP